MLNRYIAEPQDIKTFINKKSLFYAYHSAQ